MIILQVVKLELHIKNKHLLKKKQNGVSIALFHVCIYASINSEWPQQFVL